jgi:hypothetical protein
MFLHLSVVGNGSTAQQKLQIREITAELVNCGALRSPRAGIGVGAGAVAIET